MDKMRLKTALSEWRDVMLRANDENWIFLDFALRIIGNCKTLEHVQEEIKNLDLDLDDRGFYG